ncbi:lymphocyte antigen 6L [Myotis myotis]|uniref:Lymphocyte antigen 6 family member L n=1 Tax=Myotis myotis TaxID=51298 RepID=A0A7J7TJV8_MYOMY|nr:lymphocyte antigen 6L [Myotis myotis]KAF6300663.1 lymphocyte antigen 6 family member L [Myotis myotis]
MGALVLALWALLAGPAVVSVLRGRGAAPLDFADRRAQTGRNLTCFRCFKVTEMELCQPTACAPTDRVCVGHTVMVQYKSKVGVLLSKRCAPRCPNTNMAYAWLSEPWFFRRITRQCCNVSFCNGAPPAPGRPWARPGGLLLPLGLSLLAALP